MAFNPELTNWFPVKKFRFWCQKVLPLVYDDSLSYYEVLCKVVDYLNKYGEDLGVLAEDYKALVDFVNNYFEQDLSPIVQQYVDEWLDEHPEATTTVVDNSLTINKMVTGTLGYVTPQMFGALANGVHDDTQAINDAFTFCSDNGGNVFFPSGIYIISSPISIPSNTKMFGNSGKSIIRTADSFNRGSLAACMLRNDDSGWEVDHNVNIEISGITFECNNSEAGQMGVIHFGGVSDSVIDNCIIKVNGYNCWGIILFSHNNRILVRNTEIYNNSQEGNLGGCFWLRPATNGAISIDNVVENCYFESSAVDELFCIANASYANAETGIKVNDCTFVGKAVEVTPSFLVTSYLRQATSKMSVSYDNITVRGKCHTYGVAITKPADGADMSCIITNSKIDVTGGGGLFSDQIDFIAQNCDVKCDDRNSAISFTLMNCTLNRQVYGCRVYSCKVNTPNTNALISCEVVESSIIYTQRMGITVGADITLPVFYQNNMIEAGTYGINVDTGNAEFFGIITNNIIKRSLSTENDDTAGINIRRNGTPILQGNYVDSYNTAETASRFRNSVILPDNAKEIQTILPIDNYGQIGKISSGTAGTKSITHLANTPYLLVAIQAGGVNGACAFVYNTSLVVIAPNAHFTFASVSNTECTITSDTYTRYSTFRLINLSKTM